MSGSRYVGLRREGTDPPIEIVTAGCTASWPSADLLPGGWIGVPSDNPRGMEVEEAGGAAWVVLEEQSGYTVRVREAVARAGLGKPTAAPLTGAGADEAVFRIDTGNFVGLSSFAMEAPDGAPLPSVPLRIRVRKLGDPDADFRWLVNSVVDAVRVLALATQGPTTLGIRKVLVGDPYPYEDLIFLRAMVGEAERAVARIARNPHRRIVERREIVDTWLATEVSPADLVTIAADARNLAAVNADQQRRLIGAAAGAFTRGGRHLAPVRVPTVRREITYDTYENRFVRFAMLAFRRRARVIRDIFAAADQPILAGEAATLGGRLSALLRVEPFDGVGDLAVPTAPTQVLLRDESYNAFLRLYREFLLCADITWDDFRLLHENHDVAEIYEIWVFLETVRALGEILGPTGGLAPELGDLLQLDEKGLNVALAHGRPSTVTFRVPDGVVRVMYNASFIAAGAKDEAKLADRSYSLALRPDITIEVGSGGRKVRVLLDAKYRVDSIGRVFVADPEADGDDAQAVASGTFKPADIYKMHTYRDAIGSAYFAVAVYPGSEEQYYPKDPLAFRTRGGVGAIPLAPRASMSTEAFIRSLRTLIDHADSVLAAGISDPHSADRVPVAIQLDTGSSPAD